jgi:hypothetical protein
MSNFINITQSIIPIIDIWSTGTNININLYKDNNSDKLILSEIDKQGIEYDLFDLSNELVACEFNYKTLANNLEIMLKKAVYSNKRIIINDNSDERIKQHPAPVSYNIIEEITLKYATNNSSILLLYSDVSIFWYYTNKSFIWFNESL